jgi:hypothetical protein
MKIMASWFRRGRGLALGVLVGSLTLGKAFPYLVNAVGSSSWRLNVLAVSLLAVGGGLIVLLFVGDGPHAAPTAPFDAGQIAKVFRNRGVRLADFGYFGHMWELYAMWTWIPVFLRASFSARGEPPALAEAASFLVIGSGAAGCVLGGLVADRIGRTTVTSLAMAVSGTCCVAIGFLFHASPLALLALATVWGAAVVADSAQFFGLRHRARRPPLHGHRPDDPDVPGIPAHDGLDRAHTEARGRGGMALGVCRARSRTGPRGPGDAPPAEPSRSRQDRARAALTPRAAPAGRGPRESDEEGRHRPTVDGASRAVEERVRTGGRDEGRHGSPDRFRALTVAARREHGARSQRLQERP